MPSEKLYGNSFGKRRTTVKKQNFQSQNGMHNINKTPTSEEGALIKREWWQEWDKPHLPPCDAIIQSWDTAF